MVCEANCVIPVPDGLASEDAAPMMCAGATVWTALSRYGVRSTDRVGVQGVGGLGHLAIKLAAAMGCHVVVLSGSESKKKEPEGFKGLNYLLVCGSANSDYGL